MTTRPSSALSEPWPYFALAFVAVMFGFYPSFFAALATIDQARLIHGSLATAWMLLPIGQGLLIRGGKRKLHHVVGYSSLILAPLVVVSALRVIQLMALKSLDSVLVLKFVYLDVTGLALFCVFWALAILAARRRDIGLHVRLLACTALIPLEAAMERLLQLLFPTLVPNFDVALTAALFSMEAFCVAIIVAEWRVDRVRWPVPALLAYYLIIHLTATPVAENGAFQTFTAWFAHIGAR